MGLLNIFKKKKKEPEKEVKGKKQEKKKTIEKKKEKGAGKSASSPSAKKIELKKGRGVEISPKKEINRVEQKRKISKIAYRVLTEPHITEKATDLSEKNKYLFRVGLKTNKIEIKKAIKDIYGVDVIDVKIINVHRKKRKLGRQTGWRKGYKKAIVKVKEGQKIELLQR